MQGLYFKARDSQIKGPRKASVSPGKWKLISCQGKSGTISPYHLPFIAVIIWQFYMLYKVGSCRDWDLHTIAKGRTLI